MFYSSGSNEESHVLYTELMTKRANLYVSKSLQIGSVEVVVVVRGDVL